MPDPEQKSRKRKRSRDLPPLMLVTTALVVLGLVLPSALHVPLQDPSPVLEYAPVPPNDDDPPNPPPGNLNSLALGSSSTLSEDVPPPPPKGGGGRPPGKACTGKPARQTEDQMAPPCVPYFQGDNGGETWQGVTRDEVRVIIYVDQGCPNEECTPNVDRGPKAYYDLDTDPKPQCPKTWPSGNSDADKCDYIWVRIARGFNAYFNTRFQTYGRKVHFWVFFSGARDVKSRRGDAADNYDTIKPFAVIDYATYFGNNEAYDDAMAARGALVFSSRTALPNSYFRRSETFAWGFWPDVEHWAVMYSSYACTRVAPFRVSHSIAPSGPTDMTNKPRKFGLYYTSDPDEPGLRYFASLVKKRLKACGVEWAAEHQFPSSGYAVDRSDDGTSQFDAVAKFMSAGVTTVLYLGGIEGRFSAVADGQNYYPEIVLAGDLENDNNNSGRLQNQNVWRNAWSMHLQLRMDRPVDTIGAIAYYEGYPDAPGEDARFAAEAYRDYFMLFQAIQVAGPKLTPASIDQGFHAIPEKSSDNPYIASCFFDPGDFTCVKDATEVWWDPTSQSPGDQQPGCWRLTHAGQRFLPGRWIRSDDVFGNLKDACTGFDSRFQINPTETG